MPTLRLMVPELEPDGEAPLERAVLAVDGVYGAVANHEDHCLEVDFEDDVAALDDLIAAAGRAGFSARLTS